MNSRRRLSMKQESLTGGNSNSSIKPGSDSLTEFADAMPVLMWIASPEGKVVYYNAKVRDYTRSVISKAGNWAWKRLIHSSDLNSSLGSWNESPLQRKPYETEHLLRMADGSYQWHLTRAISRTDDNNNLICWYGTSTNIHAQKNQTRLGLLPKKWRIG